MPEGKYFKDFLEKIFSIVSKIHIETLKAGCAWSDLQEVLFSEENV